MTPDAIHSPSFPFIHVWNDRQRNDDPPAPGWHDEWLLTTGHGGFAMGTPDATPRRKYHALLIAAANPPVGRIALLNALDTGLRANGTIHWCGRHTLKRFERTRDAVAWTHALNDTSLTIRLRLAHQSNACRIDITADAPAELLLRPWLTLRDFHEVLPPNADFATTHDNATATVRRASGPACWLTVPGARFNPEPRSSDTRHYDLETARGLPDSERWHSPGEFTITIASNASAALHAGLADHPDSINAAATSDDALSGESQRLSALITRAAACSPALRAHEALILAADQFIVRRTVDGIPLASVIAGYPWFADWGRDTMIALPGLMLATGRHDEALACLEAFARHESEGMIPNRFDDYNAPPHYNTVDASLWFIHACREYARATGNLARVRNALLPACRSIIQRYRTGTRYNIHADPEDHLIIAGDHTTQLTWMDAKRDGIVFTPRHGKAVEINALWHHATHCLAELTDHPAEAEELRDAANGSCDAFQNAFWDEKKQRLRDCLQPAERGAWIDTDELRPNQIFAASLEFAPVTSQQRAAIVRCVRDHLLTPVGLRTLAPDHPKYRPFFTGDMMARDNAYHNGTVWPWLIGPYAEAVLRAGSFSDHARAEALHAIRPLIDSLSTGCLASIAEVYDAEPEPGAHNPHRHRRHEGCLAQAWSVAEPLRILSLIHASTPP